MKMPLNKISTENLTTSDICEAEKIDKNQIALHSDNGAPMKGATLLATLQKLGVMPSYSRPSVSNDNPFSEAMFKTLKYCHFYPENPFNLLTQARAWVERFVQWYNTEHYHSALKFITPEQRHRGIAHEILTHRKGVYEMAKQQHPERWSRTTRNWHLSDRVVLNPSGKTNRNPITAIATLAKQDQGTCQNSQVHQGKGNLHLFPDSPVDPVNFGIPLQGGF